LRTSGIDHRQQAIVVLNYHRQVNGNLYPLFFNSRLQTAAQQMASNQASNLSQALENAGYSGAGSTRLHCLFFLTCSISVNLRPFQMFSLVLLESVTLSSVLFDAGTAIQVLVDYNIPELLTTV
jgi:hypothetical protein